MGYKVAVAGKGFANPTVEKPLMRVLGRELASRGADVYTGGCYGLSYEIGVGAKEAGAKVIAVSPAVDEQDHRERFGFDTELFTDIVYFGKDVAPELRRNKLYLLMARGVAMAAMTDKMIGVYGTRGTVHEVMSAIHQDHDIGILTGDDGWDDKLLGLLNKIDTLEFMKNGRILYDEDPETLVGQLLDK